MIPVVFGSHFIEEAGTSFDITLNTCRDVFRGVKVPDGVNKRSLEYARGLTNLK